MEKQDIENNENVIKTEEKKKRGPKGGYRSEETNGGIKKMVNMIIDQ